MMRAAVCSWFIWLITVLFIDCVLSTSRCNVSNFTSSGCISNGYCLHNSRNWTTICNCTGSPCDFYLADIAETTGKEMFTVHLPPGGIGTIHSQSSQYYSPRHSYVVRLKAPGDEDIKIQFSNIAMGGDDMECPDGKMLVFDGHGYKANEYLTKYPSGGLNGYCSNDNHRRQTMQSTTGYLTVVMATDGRQQLSGFNATYSVTGAVHGGWALWSDWSACEAACESKGSQSRVRTCTNPVPRQGGRDCSGNSTEPRICKSEKRCIPHVCERGNYNGCARHAVCNVERDILDPRDRHGTLVCLCMNALCKIFVEDLCRVAPRRRILVKGSMGVLQSQLDVHYKHRQRCEVTVEGPDKKWMMFQFTEFDMGGRQSCSHGHLVVYDGVSSKNFSKRYPSLKGSGYCRRSQPPSSDDKFENVVIAEGPVMTLIMDTTTKKESIHTGFVAQFTAVENGYVHARFSDVEVKIIAFSCMGGIFILITIAMTIWCIVRSRKRRKHLRWLHIHGNRARRV